MSSFKLRISAKNVGPHEKLDGTFDVSANKTIIFAGNGCGKTFISRIDLLRTARMLDVLCSSKFPKMPTRAIELIYAGVLCQRFLKKHLSYFMYSTVNMLKSSSNQGDIPYLAI